jgi:hypothetical protein
MVGRAGDRPGPALALPAVVVAASLHYLLHWPTHGGYNFVSGPLADITLVTAFVGTLVLWYRRHNCHVFHCWRLQWHPHPAHGHPVCKRHHPDGRSVRGD